MTTMEQAIAKIKEQQSKFGENDKRYWLADQLLHMIEHDEANAALVLADLDNPDMSITALEKKIHDYANAHGGCTPPQAADKIIRDFYGMGAQQETPAAPKVVDITDLLG
ncbi:MAG: hypothetical protein IJL59_03005 [Clostridia bacterium]|nr:hypothetical protein [Clostridia bacterium]